MIEHLSRLQVRQLWRLSMWLHVKLWECWQQHQVFMGDGMAAKVRQLAAVPLEVTTRLPPALARLQEPLAPAGTVRAQRQEHQRRRDAATLLLYGGSTTVASEMQACVREICKQLRELAQEHHTTYQLEIASVRDIFLDLVACTRDFPAWKLTYQKHKGRPPVFSVTTDEITLSDDDGSTVDLGAFEVRFVPGHLEQLGLHGRGKVCAGEFLRAIALTPNKPSRDSDVTHPHVSGGFICFGEGAAQASSLLTAGNFHDLLLVTQSVLNTYSEASPYTALCDWGRPSEDGDDSDADDRPLCADCQDAHTDSTCSACSDPVCGSCRVHCASCSARMCSSERCRRMCPECEIFYCRSCLSARTTLCSSCESVREEAAALAAAEAEEWREQQTQEEEASDDDGATSPDEAGDEAGDELVAGKTAEDDADIRGREFFDGSSYYR